MKFPRHPRAFIILMCILVAVTFFIGTMHSFFPVQAAPVSNELAANIDGLSGGRQGALLFTSTASLPPPISTLSPPSGSILPLPTGVVTSLVTPGSTPSLGPTPTLIPTHTPVSAPAVADIYITDMTGIIALTILLVFVIVVGVAWGVRSSPRKPAVK